MPTELSCSGFDWKSLLGLSAMEMAEKIATRAPLAVEYGKKAVTAGYWADPKTSAQVEIGLRSQLQETHDTQEAYHAFLEKRDPAPFIGK